MAGPLELGFSRAEVAALPDAGVVRQAQLR